MAYDDGYYYGQCKIICEAETTVDNGKTVAITDGSYNGSKALADKVAEFLVPGRSRYTITLLDGATTKWSGKVEAGYGECIHVMLADGYEPVIKKTYDAGISAVSTAASNAQSTASNAQTRVGTVEGRLGSNIYFAKDSAGRFGYKDGASGTVIPFRRGYAYDISGGTVYGQTTVVNNTYWESINNTRKYTISGSGTNEVNVKNWLINNGLSNAIDYTKLTINNFVLNLVSIEAGAVTTTSSTQTPSGYSDSVPAVSKSYNASTGVLTFSTEHAQRAAFHDYDTNKWANALGYATVKVQPWLVINY